jgi:hypothetical protein
MASEPPSVSRDLLAPAAGLTFTARLLKIIDLSGPVAATQRILHSYRSAQYCA